MYLGVLQFGVFQQDWITFPDGTTNPVKEKISSLAVRSLSHRPVPRLKAAKPGPVPVCPAGTSCDHECAKDYDGYDGKTCANAAEGYCCKAMSLLDGSLAARGLSPRPAPRLDAAKPGPVPVCPAGTSCDHECAKEYDGYDGKTCANAAEGYCCKAAQTEFT